MNQVLSNPIPQIDVDDCYRRTSALDASRPSEWVRRKVVAHASQLGAERAVRNSAIARGPRSSTAAQAAVTQTRQAPSRLRLFGGVAAIAVAAIFASWYLLGSRASSGTAGTPTRQTDRAVPQVANTSQPATPEATASPPPASTGQPAVTSAPRRIEPTLSAAKPRMAKQRLSPTLAADTARPDNTPKSRHGAQNADAAQSSTASAGVAVAQNDAPGVEATSLPETTVAPTPPPAPETTAAAAPQPDEAAALPAASSPSTEPTQPASALWVAAEAGDVRGLKATLANHVNINSRDTLGRTALMLATVHGQANTVKALLSRGADPNIPDAHNQTPLHAANAGGQSLIVIILKHSGAK
jgi:uncharacterized protein